MTDVKIVRVLMAQLPIHGNRERILLLGKKVMLNIPRTMSWENHAWSMFSVLRHCEMVDPGLAYSDYVGMTGRAFQLIAHKSGSSTAAYRFNWVQEYRAFLERVGVMTDIYFALPGHPEHDNLCREAVKGIKAALDEGKGAVLWGVDVGDHGLVYGYDDDDQVFYVAGIGTSDSHGTLDSKGLNFLAAVYTEKKIHAKAVQEVLGKAHACEERAVIAAEQVIQELACAVSGT